MLLEYNTWHCQVIGRESLFGSWSLRFSCAVCRSGGIEPVLKQDVTWRAGVRAFYFPLTTQGAMRIKEEMEFP